MHGINSTEFCVELFRGQGLKMISPRTKRTAPEWSEQIRRMESGRRYRFEFAPYQREMMETPFLPDVQLTAYEMFSRGGKSEVVLNIIGHSIDEDSRRILIMYPTISQAEKFSKDVLTKELVQPTPQLDALIGDGDGRRKSGSTILHKIYPGGVINIFGSNAPGEMRRAKGNLLYADEIDAITETEGDEGDALDILWMRGSEYPNTIKIACSYPSIKGRSRIRALMESSDFRRLKTNCRKCGAEYEMHRDQITHPEGEPEKAEMVCPVCEAALSEVHRREQVMQSFWKATQPFNGVAGFHANAMYSPHPPQKGFVSHLHFLASEKIRAEKAPNPDRAKMVMVNTLDADPYEPETEKKPEASELTERRENYNPSEMLPDGIRALTAGVDCQKKGRIEVEICGFGEDFRTWGVRYVVLTGSLLQSKVWRLLDELLLMKFKHPMAGELSIAAACVDSGHAQTTVFNFTRPRRARRIFAIKGSSQLAKPLVTAPSRIGKGRGMTMQYVLGTHEAKDMIYQRLELVKADDEMDYPIGYMHFPATEEYSHDYFKGLTAEDVSLKRANDGKFYRYFENKHKIANEPLDCRVYAMAAERILNPNYDAITQKMFAQAAQNMVSRKGESESAAAKTPIARPIRKGFVTNW